MACCGLSPWIWVIVLIIIILLILIFCWAINEIAKKDDRCDICFINNTNKDAKLIVVGTNNKKKYYNGKVSAGDTTCIKNPGTNVTIYYENPTDPEINIRLYNEFIPAYATYTVGNCVSTTLKNNVNLELITNRQISVINSYGAAATINFAGQLGSKENDSAKFSILVSSSNEYSELIILSGTNLVNSFDKYLSNSTCETSDYLTINNSYDPDSSNDPNYQIIDLIPPQETVSFEIGQQGNIVVSGVGDCN